MKKSMICLLLVAATLAGCAEPMTKTQKGGLIGTGTGAAAGAVLGQAIGRDTKSTLIGAGVGALVGGLAGGAIGNYMDKQEAAMRQQLADVEGVNIQRNLDTLAVTFKSDIMFGSGSASLKSGAFDEIQRVGKVLKQYPQTNILVAGHTDSIGSDAVNQKLSEQRAESVKKVVIGEGVDPGRITTVGYGKHKPIADNSTEGGRQMNRRVTITITPNQQLKQQQQ